MIFIAGDHSLHFNLSSVSGYLLASKHTESIREVTPGSSRIGFLTSAATVPNVTLTRICCHSSRYTQSTVHTRWRQTTICVNMSKYKFATFYFSPCEARKVSWLALGRHYSLFALTNKRPIVFSGCVPKMGLHHGPGRVDDYSEIGELD